MALIGGTIVTWLQKTLKLRTCRALACSRVRAVDGAVVSNPTAKKTTWRSGLSIAIRRASSGEYTKRTSAPSALALSRLPCLPGTRIMSPNEVKMTPGCLATQMASSTRPMGITQTGQPGPCTSSTEGGSTCSMPCR